MYIEGYLGTKQPLQFALSVGAHPFSHLFKQLAEHLLPIEARFGLS